MPTGYSQEFSGQVVSFRRLSSERPPRTSPIFKEGSQSELSMYLPASRTAGADPILVTGKAERATSCTASTTGPTESNSRSTTTAQAGPAASRFPLTH